MLLLFTLFYLALLSLENIEIANGRYALQNEYPHLVSVFKYRGGGQTRPFHFCAGGLINKKTVLLAAHCFDYVRNPKTLYVHVGSTDVKSPKYGRIIHVDSAILHPLWDPAKYENGKLVNDHDIALIFLENEVEENGKDIRFMDIDSDPKFKIPENTMVDIAGWGYYKDGSTLRDMKLRTITVPVRKPGACQGCKDPIMVCAGDGRGKDSCAGDSGTTLVRVKSGEDSRWTCSGILSFGPSGCGRMRSIGVYTRVAYYSAWVWENVEKPPKSVHGRLPFIKGKFNFSCYDKRPHEDDVCSGGGECVGPNKCTCYPDYNGAKCENFLEGSSSRTADNESLLTVFINHAVPSVSIVIFCCVFAVCQGVAMGVLFWDWRKRRGKSYENFQKMTDDVAEIAEDEMESGKNSAQNEEEEEEEEFDDEYLEKTGDNVMYYTRDQLNI